MLWIERYAISCYWELNRAETDRIGWYDYFSRIIVKKIE
nr:MAG TPA: hypothetical protein [Caudoviricetes sp.]